VTIDEVPFSNIHAVIMGKLQERRVGRFEVQTIGEATSICGNFKNQRYNILWKTSVEA
jgi:hypothetical protein